MKNLLILVLALLSLSCELHKQDVFSKGKPGDSKFTLEAMEKMFAMVVSDDYFGLKKELEKDLDLNTLNKQGQSLLIEAVKLKRDLVAQLFLEKGADPQFSDETNQNAFDVINGFEDIEVWKDLLEGRGLPSLYLDSKVVSLVSQTAEDNQAESIKKLAVYFENGADINARNRRKYTLLILASSKNLPILVKFLCETEGIDINARAGRYTALSLTKKLLRRDPKLSRIIKILESYEI